MGLSLNILSGDKEYHLADRVINDYKFIHRIDKDNLAKGYPECVSLILNGNIDLIIENNFVESDVIDIKKNYKTLEMIRSWANLDFSDETDESPYYRDIEIINNYHDDKFFRNIVFSHSYIKHYEESIDFKKSTATFKIEFGQKGDKFG